MIKLDSPVSFAHHRSGWDFCNKILANFTDPNGVLCITYLDGFIGRGEVFSEPWIGFLHNTPFHPDYHYSVYPSNSSKNGANTPLSKLLSMPNLKDGLRKCKGLFTLCKYTENYLRKYLDVEISTIYHPTDLCEIKFDYESFAKNKRIVTIGHWMRNFQSTYDLISPYPKSIIDVVGIVRNVPVVRNETVKLLHPVSNSEYDELLSKTVVFLDLYDVAACNTIIECIERWTPIVTRRLPASEEYLGEAYPLFFDSLSEAKNLLTDEFIQKGHEYLKEMDKTRISAETFKQSFNSSSIFKRLRSRFFI